MRQRTPASATHAPIATRGNNWLQQQQQQHEQQQQQQRDAVSPCRNLSATRDAMATRLLTVANEASVAMRYYE